MCYLLSVFKSRRSDSVRCCVFVNMWMCLFMYADECICVYKCVYLCVWMCVFVFFSRQKLYSIVSGGVRALTAVRRLAERPSNFGSTAQKLNGEGPPPPSPPPPSSPNQGKPSYSAFIRADNKASWCNKVHGPRYMVLGAIWYPALHNASWFPILKYV